jgi:hypothetical protein
MVIAIDTVLVFLTHGITSIAALSQDNRFLLATIESNLTG